MSSPAKLQHRVELARRLPAIQRTETRATSRGGSILDKTHLHFYTLKTAREMLERAGLAILEIDIVPDVPLFRYKGRLALVNYRLAHVLPNLFSTEALFVGRPSRTVSSP